MHLTHKFALAETKRTDEKRKPRGCKCRTVELAKGIQINGHQVTTYSESYLSVKVSSGNYKCKKSRISGNLIQIILANLNLTIPVLMSKTKLLLSVSYLSLLFFTQIIQVTPTLVAR